MTIQLRKGQLAEMTRRYVAGQPSEAIARSNDMSVVTLRRILSDAGVTMRVPGRPKGGSSGMSARTHKRHEKQRKQLQRLYHDEELTQAQIGQRLGIGAAAVSLRMKTVGVSTKREE